MRLEELRRRIAEIPSSMDNAHVFVCVLDEDLASISELRCVTVRNTVGGIHVVMDIDESEQFVTKAALEEAESAEYDVAESANRVRELVGYLDELKNKIGNEETFEFLIGGREARYQIETIRKDYNA